MDADPGGRPGDGGRPAAGRGGEAIGGRLHNLKVLSDRIDDVTTVEHILGSFTRPGMTEAERARALWGAVVTYRHQAAPPNEYLAADWEAHDPVKFLNVYGYRQCCCASALIAALNRADGREARGRILDGHSVPEVRYDGGWHLFDASLIAYFPRPEDGVAASVDEIAAAVALWYDAHPGYRGDRKKLVELMRGGGWTGWKELGPELLARCPFYRRGFLPAGTHGWDDTMQEYARPVREVYEYGYHVGHRALFSLRPGESLTRAAGHRGLHVDRDVHPTWGVLKARAPEGDLAYLAESLPGYRGGVVGNGTQRYAPDLASGDLRRGAELYDNLVEGGSPPLRVREAGRPGVAVIAVGSPYVYLGGRLRLKVVGRSPGDRVEVALSTNHGRSFAPLYSSGADGPTEATIDLGRKILRRYAYWLRVEITGGAGLEAIEVENDIQHAPRTLPRLGPGTNTITVAADSDPTIATRTVACRITPEADFDKNETTGTMGVTFEDLDVRDGSCWWRGGVGAMTVPIEVPGDLVALRLCAQVRARGGRDLVRALTSTDGGKTWREVGRVAGPTPGATRSFRAADWPAGTQRALLRFELSGAGTIGLFSFRADADYRDPLAVPSRPFEVVHRWVEGDRERRHAQEVTGLPTTYIIAVVGEPELVSVTCRMPAGR